jgi:hypothetical protein
MNSLQFQNKSSTKAFDSNIVNAERFWGNFASNFTVKMTFLDVLKNTGIIESEKVQFLSKYCP